MGEGLGAEEEAQHRPFVGKAGAILNQGLYEAGLSRDEVWITNAVRCRPTNALGNNRTPTSHELSNCHGWLEDELAGLTQKRVIVALGASAARSLLQSDAPTGGVLENQGKVLWSKHWGCWIVLTVHPALVARRPGESLLFACDLIKARRVAFHGALPEPKQPQYEVIRTLNAAFDARAQILGATRLAFDWETTGLHLTQARGFCLSICTDQDPEFAWVFPRYGSCMSPLWSRSDLGRLDHEILIPLMLSPILKVGHHVSFDGNITKSTLGVYPEAIDGDTMLLHHLKKNHLGERAHGLKRMADMYTDYGRYDDPLDQWLVQHGYTIDGKPDGGQIFRAPNEILWRYAATDPIVTLLLESLMLPEVRAEPGLEEVYRTERLPLALEYMRMDREGLRVDEARLDRLGGDLDTTTQMLQERLDARVGHPLNPNSPKQVVSYLFEERGLPILGRTETGAPSTKEEYLEAMQEQEPAIPLILYIRTFGKFKGTFVDGRSGDGGLKAAVDLDGRARMSTIFIAAETFRLATRKPFPIHVIPRPIVLWTCGQHGKYLYERCCESAHHHSLNIRSLVIPDEGYSFIQADAVQQEYVIAAIVAKQTDWEEAMLDRREDAHEYVMKLLSGRSKFEYMVEAPGGKWVYRDKSAEDEYKNLRSDYKQINFSILFRAGPKKLARSLSTPAEAGRPARLVEEHEAHQMIEDYYERLYMVRQWQYETIKFLRQTGRVYSPFRTYRTLPGIFSTDKWDQWEAERQACNAPMQIGGYHVMARGVLRLAERWRGKLPLRAPFPGRVAFTIHDETVAQVRTDLVEQASADMREALEAPHPQLVGGCGIPRGIWHDLKVTEAWGGLEVDDAVPIIVGTSG